MAVLGFLLLGYLSGSLTPSIWITRLVKGVDVRDAGSGHATTTNTIRQAGFGWGALVLIIDIAKGFLPTWLALTYAPAIWIVPLTAGAAVIGHCWPVFAQFRGGMGLGLCGWFFSGCAAFSVPGRVGHFNHTHAYRPAQRACQCLYRYSDGASVLVAWPARHRVLDCHRGWIGDSLPLPDRLEPPIPGTVAGP